MLAQKRKEEKKRSGWADDSEKIETDLIMAILPQGLYRQTWVDGPSFIFPGSNTETIGNWGLDIQRVHFVHAVG